MSNPVAPRQLNPDLLRRKVSPERFQPYVLTCGGDLALAVELYEWNTSIAGAFYEALAILEVVLRNAIHDRLTFWHAHQHGRGEWYDDPTAILDEYRIRDVAQARGRLLRDGRSADPGRVVAELSFGFWRHLLARRYEPTLWTWAIRHAFPGLRPARRIVLFERLNVLVRLRNRIAHHEPVHNRPLVTLHEDLLAVAGYLDGDITEWIILRSRIPELLRTRPSPGSLLVP
jgi:hypothetical protein